MKITKFALLFLAFCLSARAQTYVNYQLASFAHSGNYYLATTNISILTNTLATVLNLQANGTVEGVGLSIKYGANPAIAVYGPSNFLNIPALGPASISVTVTSSVPNGNYCGLLAKFETVNVTPNLQGYAVQPNGKSASIALESSTNLTTWVTATNGVYAMTNAATFYRMNFQVN